MCEWLCVWCCSVFTDVSVVIRCYVSVSGYVCGVALCSPMCLWLSSVMYLCVVMCVVLHCVWCCTVFTDVSLVTQWATVG